MSYCQDGLQVYFATETQEYTTAPIYGYYELQPNDVNGKPYFKMNAFGLWWNGLDMWWIGLDTDKGFSFGYAFNARDVFCPSQLSEWNWFLFGGSGFKFAEKALGINCKCIVIQIKQFNVKR